MKEVFPDWDSIPHDVKNKVGMLGAEFKKAILAAPTIESEPVRHGMWEAYPSDGYMRCSNCRVEYLKMKIRWSYCPHCGAKMALK